MELKHAYDQWPLTSTTQKTIAVGSWQRNVTYSKRVK